MCALTFAGIAASSASENHPSAFDLGRAREEGRDTSGSNIFIHGGVKSVGCVAIGDPAIEELFLLCAETPLDKITVPIGPSKPIERSGARYVPDGMEQKDAERLQAWARLGAN